MALETANIDTEISQVEAKIATVQAKIDQASGVLQNNKKKIKRLQNMLGRLNAINIQADKYNEADAQG